MRAIVVKLVLGTDDKSAHMLAYCMGVRTIERRIVDLPVAQPALAIAKLMCHDNQWPMDLVYGLLPDGNEVFCFRIDERG